MRNSQIDFLRPILFQIAEVSTDRLEKMESLKISFSSIRIWQPMKMHSNATMECKSLYRIWVFVEATPQIVLCRTTRVRYITYIDFSHERHLFSLLYIVAFYAYTRDDPCGTWRSCLHLHLKFVKITLKVDSTRRSRITGPARLYPNKIFLSDGFLSIRAWTFVSYISQTFFSTDRSCPSVPPASDPHLLRMFLRIFFVDYVSVTKLVIPAVFNGKQEDHSEQALLNHRSIDQSHGQFFFIFLNVALYPFDASPSLIIELLASERILSVYLLFIPWLICCNSLHRRYQAFLMRV